MSFSVKSITLLEICLLMLPTVKLQQPKPCPMASQIYVPSPPLPIGVPYPVAMPIPVPSNTEATTTITRQTNVENRRVYVGLPAPYPVPVPVPEAVPYALPVLAPVPYPVPAPYPIPVCPVQPPVAVFLPPPRLCFTAPRPEGCPPCPPCEPLTVPPPMYQYVPYSE